MRRLLVILLAGLSLSVVAQTYQTIDDSVYTIAFWNLENLFYPSKDSINPDSSFTPEGEHRWTFTRFIRKLNNIRRALTHIGGWQGLDLVGVCEVENDSCLMGLCSRMPGYGFVHYDSPDRRGIDCGLLYRSSRVEIVESRAIPVELDSATTTRDLLYACCVMQYADTVHVIVCHLPSQLGGRQASEWKRRKAKNRIEALVDSIFTRSLGALIVVMGDMNSTPKDDLHGLTNLAIPLGEKGLGTHKFRSLWTMLDQFYVSSRLAPRAEMQIMELEYLREYDKRYLGYKPRRTFLGPRYQNGYSDHYPVVLRIRKP